MRGLIIRTAMLAGIGGLAMAAPAAASLALSGNTDARPMFATSREIAPPRPSYQLLQSGHLSTSPIKLVGTLCYDTGYTPPRAEVCA